jgi:hypothetical protein
VASTQHKSIKAAQALMQSDSDDRQVIITEKRISMPLF